MALSGTTTFNRSTLQIMERALRICGVISEGNSASTAQKSNANEALNAVIKSLQTQGVMLWTREEVQLDIPASSEVTGTDGEIYKCIKPHTSSSDSQPITGSDWTEYWTKDGSTGGTWVTSTAYTASNVFSIPAGYYQMEKIFIREDGDDTDLDLLMYDDYLSKGDKFSDGKPYLASFNETASSVTGYLYPYPDKTTYGLFGLGTRFVQDMLADADDPDFPSRWISVLIWGLVAELAPEYNRDGAFVDRAERKFSTYLRDAQKNNTPIADRSISGAYPIRSNNAF